VREGGALWKAGHLEGRALEEAGHLKGRALGEEGHLEEKGTWRGSWEGRGVFFGKGESFWRGRTPVGEKQIFQETMI